MITHQTPKALESVLSSFLKWSSRNITIFRFLFVGTLVLLSVNRGLAKTYTVSNENEFNALPDLRAGDIVQMQSGTYGSLNKNIISTIASDDVAISNPIKIYAVKPGGVLVNAPSYLLFSGRGIIFAGVDFGSGCGQLSTNADIVRANYSSRYITFSHLRFTACGSTNSSGNDVHWIRLGGFNNTIEYCSFNERPENSSNATVWIMPDISEGGIDLPRNHWIHHCYFGTRYAGTVNGFEAIRIGVGDVQTFDLRTVVEKNVFYRSIWRTDGTPAGEPEIISNKSKGNIIRNNTILESQGGICLRTGQYCTVEGNFILGSGYYSGGGILMGAPSIRQRGIRVIGKNHIIRNNYVANMSGTDAAAALCVMSGEANYYEGDPANYLPQTGSYLPADNAQIYNNTFINCAEMNLGYLAPDSYGAPASPTGVRIYNNVWQGNGTASSVVVRDTTSTTSAPGYIPIVLGGSGGNYIYETSSTKYGWNGLGGGFYSASVSPAITETLGNYKIPTSSSPLLGTADTTLCATTDIRGFTRPATGRDIGSYERDATGTTAYAPMLRSEVGAFFDGGPAVPSYYPTVSLYESFETYTIGNAIPTVALPGTTGVKASGQVTVASGGSLLGSGTKVAWLNDIISATGGSGQLELNAFDVAQSTLLISFDIANNAQASASGTQPLNIGLLAWNTAVATAGGSTAKRICGVTFNQDGSLTTPGFSVQGGSGGGVLTSNLTYDRTKKQTVNIYANDQDASSVNYLGSDGLYRILAANSFAVFLNQVFVGAFAFNTTATDNSGTLLAGNSNLGRVGFNTSTTNLGNWLIDNVSMSTMPTGIVITQPTIASPATASGQVGVAFNYTPIFSGTSPEIYAITGTLPNGLTFDSASGVISGVCTEIGTFPVTITATNAAGSGSVSLTMTFTQKPPNIFSGSNPSLGNASSWSLLSTPGASSNVGSFADLVFNSGVTSLNSVTLNIYAKSYNVTNGSAYVLSSGDIATLYRVGNTGITDATSFTNMVTGLTNQLVYLANNSSITFSRLSPGIFQLRNSGTLRVESGSTLDIQTDVTQASASSAFGWTKIGGGTLKLSGSNSYTGASIVQEGTLALSGSGTSAVTVKSNAVLEIALSNPGTATFSNAAAVSLESGSKVRVTGTPTGGATYTLISGSSLTSLVTLESPVSDYQLAVLNNSLVLQPIPAVINSPITGTGMVNSAFTYQISASGNPTSYGATGLPAGLSLDTTTGKITGTPAVSGTYSVTVTATNAGGAGSMALTFNFTDEFDVLRLKWRDSLIATGGTTIDSNALKYWTGSSPINTTPSSSAFYLWSDLPLNTLSSGNMRDTFDRLEKMALGYANPNSIYYQNATLATAVVNGLNWMVANVYNGTNTYDNWYHWMITGSENFANAALLVYPALSQTQITSYYTKLQYYSPSGGPNGQSLWLGYNWSALTGSNIAEAAFVMTLNGILYKSSVKLTEGRTNLLRVFPTVMSGDGFYSDGGYIFHSNAVENGSYGLALIVAVTNVTDLLYGSAWALAESDSSKVYSAWIPQGLMPFYYQGALMHMIRGRSYTSSGSTASKAGSDGIAAMQGVANWSFIPETEKGKLTAFANTPHPAVGQYMFPSIDRVVAHRSNFSLGLSLSSSRTCNWDPMRNTPSTQNNDKGWNTADGMTSLYVGSTDTQFTGNIWPTMDWYHMTGTTAEQNYQAQPGTPSENWAGGAEVSGYGVAGMSLHPVGSSTSSSTLYGKKSYFMLEREVVCLGSGITAGSANEIHTTVENRRMGSSTASVNLWVDGVANSRPLNWSTDLSSPKSCAIEGVGGYYFPDSPNNIRAEFVPSSGTWKGIHPYDSDTATYTDNYLRLIFNHGARPSGATSTYAYILLPAMTPASVTAYSQNPQSSIIANTSSMQAVKNLVDGVVGANFWSSSGGTADLITVNKSCAVITKETYNSIAVGISDPSQSLTEPNGVITVTLNRTGTLSTKDPKVTVLRTTPTIQFTANVSAASGGTIHATFTLQDAPVITSNLNTVGITGTPVSYQITASGNPTGYGATGLPPGMSVNTTTGAITGVPTAIGTYTSTLSATNGSGRAGYATLTLQISDSLTITSNPSLVALTGNPVAYQITSDALQATYTTGSLPPGLKLNGAGLIYGTPTASGTYTTTLYVTNPDGGTGRTTLRIQVGSSLSNLSSTFGASTTWVCPANVTAVQVECWGGGGAGGSGVRGTSKAAMGGGGAGGAYARLNSYPVVPGRTYYINIGAGGISSTNDLATVPGGDSWFNSNNVTSTLVLAKGGAGGRSVVTTTNDVYGTGGTGTTTGSIGNVLFAGGNGATSTTNVFGGGGGGSAGISLAGNAPASTTNGLGAVAVARGGNGGNANPSSTASGDGQSPTDSPGGGGGGARSGSTTQKYGGTGAAGQVILTVQAVAKVPQTITFGLDPATAKVGDVARTLIATSSSDLPVTLTSSDSRVATFTSGNTLNIVGAGTTTLTATQTGDGNYEAASPVSVSLIVSAASSGTTFASWSGNAAVTSESVYKYAFGAADKNSAEQQMTSSIVNGKLSLTAVVRTDDPTHLVITAKSATSLTGVWSASTKELPITVSDGDSTGLGTGLARKIFTVDRAVSLDSKRFLKLEAVYTP